MNMMLALTMVTLIIHKCKIKISLFSENENEFEINMVAANIADLNSVQEDIISSVKSVKGLYGLIFRNEDFTKINYYSKSNFFESALE